MDFIVARDVMGGCGFVSEAVYNPQSIVCCVEAISILGFSDSTRSRSGHLAIEELRVTTWSNTYRKLSRQSPPN